MELMLRKAVIQDLTDVVKIFKAAIRVMSNNGIDQCDNIYPDEEILREDILKSQMFLGKINGRIASVAVINQECNKEYETGNWRYKTYPFIVIHRLCVNPDFQNQGIGKRTLMVIERMLKRKNIKSIRLDAFSLNPIALRLYEKNGYKKVGKINFRKGIFYLYEKGIKI
ncbi:GNAT family N-acetyltransferase [Clostridium luticellarii]|jgi:ribosomal protein S18 acetylase RimI-like enzyme|uniref:Ribosomal-protein-alanine N-acetyltransferase n=1 Tax=Clostridium luticellarii TaxID=1691940 RepID=A0A2T0BKP2_9CLOT|nr:GNAT family N-acetyltransferase [Clostridium luticellarii]MCI1946162.1 GNAT family N-acetyltransferase [Clostridium luticellarii]MCI1969245.1 GNAT family N-acetyltransferase [Clostridium luticellarii]PRR84464.1 ribosomal-protein-alanine N-acetyltransferase [Clostridium luticellarii]